MKKHVIWSGKIEEIEAVAADLRQDICAGEFYMGLNENSSEDDIWEAAAEMVSDYRDDEKPAACCASRLA